MNYLNKALLFIVGLGSFNVVVGFLLSSSIVSADDGERYLDGGDYVGHFGFYWSSVVGYVGDGCGLANMLSFDLTSKVHEDSSVTMRELSVRCVAR